MTTPDKPLRVEFEVEVPGTPDQVWQAIASADGISSWFLPTDFDPGVGGAVLTHMGEEDSSPATITGWEPGRRLAYEEPEWAELVGHPGAPVTPLTTEFLVEARSGGTCVVRVTASAFGTGAEWEDEFLDDMALHYMPFFDLLGIYVERYSGQRAVQRELRVGAAEGLEHDDVVPAAAASLGLVAPGDALDAARPLGLSGTAMRIGRPYLMVDVGGPVPGYVIVQGLCGADEVVTIELRAWLFGPDAEAFVAGAEDGWRDWLAALGR